MSGGASSGMRTNHTCEWKCDVLLTGSWRGATSTLLSAGRHHVVVDTGLPHEAHQLVAALESRGLRPDDISTVINTHLHVDHVLNNYLFPSSTIYASQQSYDWCCSLYAEVRSEDGWEDAALRYYPETLEEAKFVENMSKLRNFALRWWDIARLGARSQYRWIEKQPLPDGLEPLITSGHVPGHASVIVQGAEQRIVIAADALLSREHDDQVLTMIPYNRAQYLEDRARILSLDGYIIPGHDQGFRSPTSAADAHPPSEQSRE
jgi:glyoxylase-like metal-dependent hydrolase (beta-lactamase superfamily II)